MRFINPNYLVNNAFETAQQSRKYGQGGRKKGLYNKLFSKLVFALKYAFSQTTFFQASGGSYTMTFQVDSNDQLGSASRSGTINILGASNVLKETLFKGKKNCLIYQPIKNWGESLIDPAVRFIKKNKKL